MTISREVIAKQDKVPMIAKRVEQLLLQGLDAGNLNRGRMNPKLLEKLEAARAKRRS